MVTIDQLYERAEKQGIEIDYMAMRELPAASYPEGWIVIDRRRYDSERALKCDLAHEIGHVETGAFYNIYSPYDLKSKCEYKANKRAAEILMPLDEVWEAMHHGCTGTDELCEWFDVTPEFAEMALELYADKLLELEGREQLNNIVAIHHIAFKKKKTMPLMKRARDLIPQKPLRLYESSWDDWKNDVYLTLPVRD